VPDAFVNAIKHVASLVSVAVVTVDATLAVPVNDAVIVPALKLPDPSRATIALTVFALVALVAELDTFRAVEIVANFVSTMAAAGSTSLFVINDVDSNPVLEL
jgi:hypothetical protein